MKKLKFMAGLVGVLLAVGLFFHPQGTVLAGSGSTVWGTTVTSSSSTPLYLLGTLREEPETDSSGTKVYVYARVWGLATTGINIGDVLYDTTVAASPNGFNFTTLAPVASFYDSSGIVDSATFKYTPRSPVAGVAVGTVSVANYTWVQVRGLAQVRMVAPQVKGNANQAGGGYAGRFYRAGMAICGSGAGVNRVATVPSAAVAGLQSYRTYQDILGRFGRVAVNATQDSTLVKAYIDCWR